MFPFLQVPVLLVISRRSATTLPKFHLLPLKTMLLAFTAVKKTSLGTTIRTTKAGKKLRRSLLRKFLRLV
jgi:hypothetical protein